MPAEDSSIALFSEAVQGLQRGDFSRLAPLLEDRPLERRSCQIIEWYDKGYFAAEPAALAEALTCSCFLGRTGVAEFLLDRGVDPAAAAGTGLNAFHWAANRGQSETVRLLIRRKAPLRRAACTAVRSSARRYGRRSTSRGPVTYRSSRICSPLGPAW